MISEIIHIFWRFNLWQTKVIAHLSLRSELYQFDPILFQYVLELVYELVLEDLEVLLSESLLVNEIIKFFVD
jgi:hypothetical protein